MDVDLSVPSEGVTALYGPSGCGKTSLLRAVAGLDQHIAERVRFKSRDWQSANEFVPTHRRELAYVFQEANLFTHLNVDQNLNFASKRVPKESRVVSTDQVIELLGLQSLMNRAVDDLSGGEQQRVSIARALCSSPKLLLMDEPLSALDRDAKREILPYIETLNRELRIPIIYVSHSLDEVARLADYLVLFESRRIVSHGPIQTMLTRTDLPLARDVDAESIVEATVEAHDDEYGLTKLNSKAGCFFVSKSEAPLGQPVRVRIAARDVSITLTQQSGSSILNILSLIHI